MFRVTLIAGTKSLSSVFAMSVRKPEPEPQEWHWPVNLQSYDRSPVLKAGEKQELAFLVTKYRGRNAATRALVVEMHRRGSPYWCWSDCQWVETVGSTVRRF